MSDYISRKDAVEWFMSFIMMDEDKIPADTVVGDLKTAIPAADVEPVRHGRWELHGNDDDVSASYFCSLCGYNFDEDEFLDRWSHIRYCPNCGAKMDLEAENHVGR